jgi:flagellar P-ring protein FlgI
VRIKEVAAVQGVRSNQLVGYGLVVGLDGSGDQTTQTPFTTQSLNNDAAAAGRHAAAGTNMQLKNVAAVMVTAQLPPFAQPGQAIDITCRRSATPRACAAAPGATPLKGADGQVYALAQGNLIVGGAGAAANGSKVQINHLSGRPHARRRHGRARVPTPWLGGEHQARTEPPTSPPRARWPKPSTRQGRQGHGARAGRPPVRCGARRPSDERVASWPTSRTCRQRWRKPSARVVLNARTGSVVMNDA